MRGYAPGTFGRLGDADRRARFVREGRAATAPDHPNLMTIHDTEEGVIVSSVPDMSGSRPEDKPVDAAQPS